MGVDTGWKGEGEGRGFTVVAGSHRQQDLSYVHACHRSVGFPPGAAHARLQPVGAGTGQHLVDAHHMVRVGAHSEVEAFFAGHFDKVSMWEISVRVNSYLAGRVRGEVGSLGEVGLVRRYARDVLVGTNTSGFERFR